MLRVSIIILSFSILACSSDRPAPVAPAGKATCVLCDFLGDDRFTVADGQGAANEAEADSTSSNDKTDSTSPDDEPEVVAFADANLERVIRRALKKLEGPLTVADLASLVRIDAEEQGIKSLAGIEYCSALDTLRLWGNEIEDLSPLSGLPSLTFLNLADNQIKDISALSSLTGLKWLSLWNNDIEDISPLSELAKLTYLNLGSNQIEDISPLSGMVKLRSLNLAANKVVDVSALDGLTKLDYLGLLDNPIKRGDLVQQVPTLIERYITISLGRPGSQTELGRPGSQSEPCTYPEGALLYTAGTQISPLVLPELQSEHGTLTPSVLGLPPGLSFNPDTRTVYGTPTDYIVSTQSRCGTSHLVAYVGSIGGVQLEGQGYWMVIRP